MKKTLTIIGCILWIAGLAAAITGMNLTGTAAQWLTVAGNIVFLIGLGIVGAMWLRRRKSEGESDKHNL